MVHDLLKTPIEYLKGVGPQRADLLKTELGIFTYGDILYTFPFRYVDRSRFYSIREVQSTSVDVQIKGRITKIEEVGAARAKRLVAQFEDENGKTELVWFRGIQWVKKGLQLHTEYVLFGKPTEFNGKINFAHPELELWSDFEKSILKGLQPVYPSTEKLSSKGLHSKGLAKLIATLLPQIKSVIHENLPPYLIQKLRFPSRVLALEEAHFPRSTNTLELSIRRLKFEEFFFIQLGLLVTKQYNKRTHKGHDFKVLGENFNTFYKKHLPFELTNAQKRVIREIRLDTNGGKHMNRLVQGDVGSGKTVVALMCMLMAIDNGLQACMMAPTEILAQQHFNGLSELLQPMPLKIALLTGSTKAAERKKIHQGLEDGSIHIVIGTHALIEDKVKFQNLGLAVIDEQHRFGVAQRAALWKKNAIPPHILVMTATPIPRTLAMSLYGDLDLSVIDELPPGRKPIQTVHRYDSNRLRVFDFIRKEIALGRQIYIVYPLIQESEKMDYKDLEDGYESICREFPLPDYKISIVHGKMKPQDKEFEMERFVRGETQIMVATTVIEVGVNVPNASVMIIESAERFGLSQLHQLRGRVGRGSDQSYCILMTSHKLTADGKVRIETMCKTNDGFEIADVDLELRGPGDLMGTRQSGMLDLKIANISKDQQLLTLARNEAQSILSDDPRLEKIEHTPTRLFYLASQKENVQWGRIS